MRDWRDEENDRRMDEMYARRGGDDHGGNDIIEFFVYILIGFVVILAVAGFLDSHFGWGITDWIWNALHEWTDGAIGRPSS